MNKYAIGIDLGGTKILTALINKQSGEVVAYVKKKTKKERGVGNIVKKTIESGIEILKEAKIERSEIQSIGVGVAGQVDREKGILISAANLDCDNLRIKEILENAKISVPLQV